MSRVQAVLCQQQTPPVGSDFPLAAACRHLLEVRQEHLLLHWHWAPQCHGNSNAFLRERRTAGRELTGQGWHQAGGQGRTWEEDVKPAASATEGGPGATTAGPRKAC